MQGFRYEQRKKKRINRVLNVAISIVTILILFFAYQIFFGTTTSEVMTEEMTDEEETDFASEEKTIESEQEEVDTSETSESEIEPAVEDEDAIDNEETEEPASDGEWQPIGTEQAEFTPGFTEGSLNRLEMEQAVRYATGISQDNMILWRIENGGAPTRARGVISEKATPDLAYEVYIEWVDGQGWMPVEKNELESNPYR